MVKKSLLIGGVALMTMAAAPLAASAQAYGYGTPYNSACERQNSDNKAAGTVVGALLGAAAGGAMATMSAIMTAAGTITAMAAMAGTAIGTRATMTAK